MPDLPDGVVTFVFTDVEGSTSLWEDAPRAMMGALVRHDEVIDAAVADHGGISVKPRGEGDSRFLVFRSAHAAVVAGAAIQRALRAVEWPTPRPLRVRMSLHTGTAELMEGDYYGSAVNRAARLRGIAHGGQTIMSRSTYELVRDELPDELGARDMGEHRLKDLTRPEHVYQLDVEGIEPEFPPLASLDVVRTNLPVQLTDFVGRTRELMELEDAVRRSRLVTILAPGGAGKTRLAIQAAAELAADFRDGVFFADLAPIDDAEDAPQVIAEAIGVTLGGDEELDDQLIGHLRGNEMLLVVDNLEHVLEAGALISRMLTAAQAVRIIATSRTKLAIAGEAVFRITGLEHDWDSIEQAFESAAVRLFVDAARRADTSFRLTGGDLEPLSRILDLVGGLPLGILLAASWVDALSVAEIAGEITRSMDFLESDAGDVVSRHRSMRAVFDYSWALLEEQERETLAALSVFRGGFTRDAASEVAGASLRALTRLEARSLISLDVDAGRYWLHELVREYGGEHLEGDAREEALDAHMAYFARLAREAADAVYSSRDQVMVLGAFEADFQNARSALRRATERRDAAAARDVVIALQGLVDIRGWLRASYEIMEDVSAEFPPGGEGADLVVGALAELQLARLGTNLGIAEGADATAERALGLLRGAGDDMAFAIALEGFCEVMTYAGRPDDVLAGAREAIEFMAARGHEMLPAAMRNYEALAYLIKGSPQDAMEALLKGDEVLARLGEVYMRPWNLEIQASIHLMAGNVADAVAIHLNQVEIARSAGYSRVLALGLGGLGSAFIATGEIEKARDRLHEALEIFERLGMVVEKALTLIDLATTWAAVGDPDRAVEALSALSVHRTAESPHPFQPVMIGDLVTSGLRELESGMSDAAFVAATASGKAKGFDTVVKEALAGYEGSTGPMPAQRGGLSTPPDLAPVDDN